MLTARAAQQMGAVGIRQRLRSELSPVHPAPPVWPVLCHKAWAAFPEHPSASPTHPMAWPQCRGRESSPGASLGWELAQWGAALPPGRLSEGFEEAALFSGVMSHHGSVRLRGFASWSAAAFPAHCPSLASCTQNPGMTQASEHLGSHWGQAEARQGWPRGMQSASSPLHPGQHPHRSQASPLGLSAEMLALWGAVQGLGFAMV